MDEHQRLLALLERLREIAALDLATLGQVQRTHLLEEVLRIASALIAAEPHHRREENVLFPALRAHGLHGDGFAAAKAARAACRQRNAMLSRITRPTHSPCSRPRSMAER